MSNFHKSTMRNSSKPTLSREDINKRFRELSESDEDLLASNSSYQDYCDVIDRHKDTIIKNLKQNGHAEV